VFFASFPKHLGQELDADGSCVKSKYSCSRSYRNNPDGSESYRNTPANIPARCWLCALSFFSNTEAILCHVCAIENITPPLVFAKLKTRERWWSVFLSFRTDPNLNNQSESIIKTTLRIGSVGSADSSSCLDWSFLTWKRLIHTRRSKEFMVGQGQKESHRKRDRDNGINVVPNHIPYFTLFRCDLRVFRAHIDASQSK